MLIRHLLLTVFERVGDGTATTAVLTRSLVHRVDRYLTSGPNPRQLESGLEYGLEMARDKLRCLAQPIEGADALATIVAAVVHEPTTARIVGEILDATGPDGAVIVEGGEALQTTYEYFEGERWNEGLVSEVLLNGSQTTVRMIEPRILITDCVLERPEQLLPVPRDVRRRGRAAAVHRRAGKVREPVVALLAVNRNQGVFELIAAARAPSVGDLRASILLVAAVSGARFVQAAAGRNSNDVGLADLGVGASGVGHAASVWLSGRRGSRAAIRQRVAEARAELSRVGDDRHLQNMTQQRIGKLLGLGGSGPLGAATPLARDELVLRTEAAVTAARLSLREGVVTGGGAALVACAETIRCTGMRGDLGDRGGEPGGGPGGADAHRSCGTRGWLSRV